MHLPVAPACNIQCRYCIRKNDCANESRPGITSRVLAPWEAVERVEAFIGRNDRISVVGIAGPGDPLANEMTFETLQAINRQFPDLTLCVSTNGLALSDRLEDLMKAGVKSLTVTINAVTPETAEKVYAWVLFRGKRFTGKAAAGILVKSQWQGLMNAIEAGLIVKVNSVLIPGVNESELPLIAERAGNLGADIMNILPLIPQAEFSHLTRPTPARVHELRDELKGFIPQMSHCKQCRADACGTLGEDKDMEFETLMARIADDYSEMVM
jgi:nitrogen fixation protein NifB